TRHGHCDKRQDKAIAFLAQIDVGRVRHQMVSEHAHSGQRAIAVDDFSLAPCKRAAGLILPDYFMHARSLWHSDATAPLKPADGECRPVPARLHIRAMSWPDHPVCTSSETAIRAQTVRPPEDS